MDLTKIHFLLFDKRKYICYCSLERRGVVERKVKNNTNDI